MATKGGVRWIAVSPPLVNQIFSHFNSVGHLIRTPASVMAKEIESCRDMDDNIRTLQALDDLATFYL